MLLDAKPGRLIDCVYQCVRVFMCLRVGVIIVYAMCRAVAHYSLPPSLPFPLYVSLSQHQWHIEGRVFWLVNLMEPLPCGATASKPGSFLNI